MSQRTERGRNGRLNRGWFKKGYDTRRPVPNPGWFRNGFYRRRHVFSHDERVRRGMTVFRKFLFRTHDVPVLCFLLKRAHAWMLAHRLDPGILRLPLRTIFAAASQAGKAVDCLDGLQPQVPL